MSDMGKYLNVLNEAYTGKTKLKENAKKGEFVRTNDGVGKVVKVFDDGYMVKLTADGQAIEVELEDSTVIDLEKEMKKGARVKHKHGLGKITKVFDDGFMVKLDNGEALEVDKDEIVLI